MCTCNPFPYDTIIMHYKDFSIFIPLLHLFLCDLFKTQRASLDASLVLILTLHFLSLLLRLLIYYLCLSFRRFYCFSMNQKATAASLTCFRLRHWAFYSFQLRIQKQTSWGSSHTSSWLTLEFKDSPLFQKQSSGTWLGTRKPQYTSNIANRLNQLYSFKTARYSK